MPSGTGVMVGIGSPVGTLEAAATVATVLGLNPTGRIQAGARSTER